MIFKCGGLYTDSTDWITNNKLTIDPKNEENQYFQYAATVALNYGEIKYSAEREYWTIEPFIGKYCSEGINNPSKLDDWKGFEKNNNCS